jgi:HAD superfamily hydrolase (TIGR01509 family)
VHAAKDFSNPEQFRAIMDEISGPDGIFRGFELRRSTGFGKVTYTVTGTLEPPASLDAFSDPAVGQLLGGNPLGRPTTELASESANLSLVLGVVMAHDVKGDADRRSGRRAEWDVAVGGEPRTIAVHATHARGAARLWTAIAALAAVLALVSLAMAVTRRPRRSRRDRVPAGVALPPTRSGVAVNPSSSAAPRHVVPQAPKVAGTGAQSPESAAAPSGAAGRAGAAGTRRINVVVVDAMGVLYREADDVAALLVPFVRERGGIDDALAIRAHYVDASLGRHTTRSLWSLLGVRGDVADLDRAYVERLELNEGVHHLLDAMDKRGIAVAALSNDVSEWSRLARARFGLGGRISPWVVSGDVGVRKPDSRIFSELARALDVPLRACLFVDDNPDNLAVARAQGMAVVHFAPEPVEGSPYRRIGSLYELISRGRVAT